MLCCACLQVMLLLASAPRSPFLRNDLGSSGKLQFKAHARELGAQAVQLLDVDLAPLVHLPARHPAGAPGPLSNGHQTMVIGAVYTVSCAEPAGYMMSLSKDAVPYGAAVLTRGVFVLLTLDTQHAHLCPHFYTPFQQIAVLAVPS